MTIGSDELDAWGQTLARFLRRLTCRCRSGVGVFQYLGDNLGPVYCVNCGRFRKGREPEQCNKYPCDCDLLGNDGLTHTERREYADRYARGPGNTRLTSKESAALHKMRERRRAEQKEA